MISTPDQAWEAYCTYTSANADYPRTNSYYVWSELHPSEREGLTAAWALARQGQCAKEVFAAHKARSFYESRIWSQLPPYQRQAWVVFVEQARTDD